jgi:hypothetical protein
MPRSFRSGQRVRVSTVDTDGLPTVRYGTIGADVNSDDPVVVMYDDLLGSDTVNSSEIELLDLDAIELRLTGRDLLDDPLLRAGLAELWRAEVGRAGLVVATLFPMGKDDVVGVSDSEQFLLAEFTYNGETWVVRGAFTADAPTMVVIRADRMNRWNGFIH